MNCRGCADSLSGWREGATGVVVELTVAAMLVVSLWVVLTGVAAGGGTVADVDRSVGDTTTAQAGEGQLNHTVGSFPPNPVGDANQDGSVDIGDAQAIAQNEIGQPPSGFSPFLANATRQEGGPDIGDAQVIAQLEIGAVDPPNAEVVNFNVSDTVVAGGSLDGSATIENTGGVGTIQQLTYRVAETDAFETVLYEESVDVVDLAPVSFDGNAADVGFSVTPNVTSGEYVHGLFSGGLLGDNGSATASLTVETSVSSTLDGLDIAGQGASADIDAGENRDVAVNVTNIGDQPGSFDVSLAFDSDSVATQSSGTVGAGETETVTLTNVTGNLSSGIYTVTASTADDTVTGDLTVVNESGSGLYGGGDGTASDPYQIVTWNHLDAVRANLDASFTVLDTLNETTTGYDQVANGTANNGDGFSPLGTDSEPFSGTFTGNDNAISGLVIDRPDESRVGLFGTSTGTVESTVLSDVTVTGGDDTGAVAGYSQGVVQTTSASGTVSSAADRQRTGGLVGRNDGSVSGASAAVDVAGGKSVGGLVGFNTQSATVSGSAASGTVTGNNTVGGLVGRNDATTIAPEEQPVEEFNAESGVVTRSYATGDVVTNRSGGNTTAGGLVGRNLGTVETAYATGNVTSDQIAGGLLGWNNGGTVAESYAVGTVSGTNIVGGLVGYNNDRAGQNAALGTSYWSNQATGQEDGVGSDNSVEIVEIEAFLTDEMRGSLSEANLDGFDFVSTWGFVEEDIGEEGVTVSYPYLVNNKQEPEPGLDTVQYGAGGRFYGGGSGTVGDPYLIANWYHLDNVRANRTANFKLATELNETTVGFADVASKNGDFTPIGNGNKFTGRFDGNDKTIRNLSIIRPGQSEVGLFSRLRDSADVFDLKIANWTVKGNDQTGAVAGYLLDQSEIDRVAVTDVVVQGQQATGGLVGDARSRIENVFVTGEVYQTGNSRVGGLVGRLNGGEIQESYAIAEVVGSSDVGGLVGRMNNGVIEATFAAKLVAGRVSTGGVVGSDSGNAVIRSYWDAETTLEDTTARNGIRRTTEEMVGPSAAGNMSSLDFDNRWATTADSYPVLATFNKSFQLEARNNARTAKSDTLAAMDGTGAPSDPFVISKPEHVQAMTDDPVAVYTLDSDVDAGSVESFDPIDGQFTYRGSSYNFNEFIGVLDGDGHAIRNLSIDRPGSSDVGLFYRLRGSARVSDIQLDNWSVRGNDRTGALVGWQRGSEAIQDVAVTDVSVRGQRSTGGLAGRAAATIERSFVTGEIYLTNDERVGGVVGRLNGGTLKESYAIAEVVGNKQVAGLVGRIDNADIEDSFAAELVVGRQNTGGLVANDNGNNVRRSYWDGETTLEENNARGGTRLTTEQMQGASATENMDEFDFDSTWTTTDGYPVLQAIDTALQVEARDYTRTAKNETLAAMEGTGTARDPFVVSELAHLRVVTEDPLAVYTMADDIDASSLKSFEPIDGQFTYRGGSYNFGNGFLGVFDGNGHTIQNLSIDRPGQGEVGLFQRLRGTSRVSDLTLANWSVEGNDKTGALVGWQFDNSVIQRVAVTDLVLQGQQWTGGIAGVARSSIEESFVTGELYLTNDRRIGGLVGRLNGGTLQKSYAVAEVVGEKRVAGLVARMDNADIEDSFAAGLVAGRVNTGGLVANDNGNNVRRSYWDGETTLERNSAGGGTRLTTDQMQGASAAENMSEFDFQNTWTTTNGYPVLQAFDTSLQLEARNYTRPAKSETLAAMEGTGVPGDPFVVSEPEHIQAMTDDPIAVYTVAGDIDASAVESFDPIDGQFTHRGRSYNFGSGFTGILDGNGHAIRNLSIDRPGQGEVGLFQRLRSTSRVSDLTLANWSVEGNDKTGALVGWQLDNSVIQRVAVTDLVLRGQQWTGGIAGIARSSIEESFVTGEIYQTNDRRVGGLVGRLEGGTLQKSYAVAEVFGQKRVGGLVGRMDNADIEDSFAARLVAGQQNTGGLVAVDNGNNVRRSYWDGETTLEETNARGGTRLTTEQMQGASAAENMDEFDFQNTWTTTNGYPVLQAFDTSLQVEARNYTRPAKSETLAAMEGTGVPGDPFVVSEPEHIQAMTDDPIAVYTVAGDIDASTVESFDPIDGQFTHRGQSYNVGGFIGILDGNDKTIQNLSIRRPGQSEIGLFERLRGPATVVDLSLDSWNIEGNDQTGTLAGYQLDNRGLIRDVAATDVVVRGQQDTGGLVGNARAEIRRSFVTGEIYQTNDRRAGGLVGRLEGAELKQSYAVAEVVGEERVGGLVGRIDNADIEDSFAARLVAGRQNTGGLVAVDSGNNVRRSYWDGETTLEETNARGGVQLTTEQMQGASAAENMDEFDFQNTWTTTDGYPVLQAFDTAHQVEARNYTRPAKSETLAAMEGTGAPRDPFVISEPDHLQAMTDDPIAVYTVADDINASAVESFDPIDGQFTHRGQSYNFGGFIGILEGNGHTISDFSLSRPGTQEVGLFQRLRGTSRVSDLILANWSVEGNDRTGALVGLQLDNSLIAEIAVTDVVVQGEDESGGLAGYTSAAISDVFVTGEVYQTNDQRVGGIVGRLRGQLQNSYAVAEVVGNNEVGGLVGRIDNGDLKDSFAAEMVAGRQNTGGMIGTDGGNNVRRSYWDNQTTFEETSARGGTRLTTEQMQGASALTNMSELDFDSTWTTTDGYPVLQAFDTALQLEARNYTRPAKSDTLAAMDGTGSARDPFVLAESEHLQAMTEDPVAVYTLTDSFDAGALESFDPVDGQFTHRGQSYNVGGFVGILDGDGHAIRNVSLSKPGTQEVGLFQRLRGTSRVTDIQLDNWTVAGNDRTGALVGLQFDNSLITGVAVTDVAVQGEFETGGLAGYSNARISETFVTGEVYQDRENRVGGIVGRLQGQLQNSYAIAEVVGNNEVGGLIGRLNNGDLEDSFAAELVAGRQNTGGMIGTDGGNNVRRSYWDNQTTFEETSARGGTRLTTKQMQDGNAVENMSGLDFQNTWTTTDSYPILQRFDKTLQLDARQYTRPAKNETLAAMDGTGSARDPFALSEPEHLQAMTADPVAVYTLTDDLEVGSLEGFTPVDGQFTHRGESYSFDGVIGVLDGNGHAIRNLSISRPDRSQVGLFERLRGSARVTHIEFADWTVEGGDRTGAVAGQQRSGALLDRVAVTAVTVQGEFETGGLVGYSNGRIQRSFVTGGIYQTADNRVGGLVGRTQQQVERSYSLAKVVGENEVGGLVGRLNNANLEDSFAAGNVTGDSNTGGLIGSDGGNNVRRSYWDVEGTGQETSPRGGTGLTTAEMSGASALTNMSEFDFQSTWATVENPGDYPTLRALDRTGTGVGFPYAGGNGTAESPYRLTNWYHLFNVRENPGANFELENELNETTPGYGQVAGGSAIGDPGFRPLGTTGEPFAGVFDGDGNAITGLIIDRPGEDEIGLFGNSSGMIERVQLPGVDVTGASKVGSLVGHSRGTVQNVSVSGTVFATGEERRTGGLVGLNTGDVASASADVEVMGGRRVGGLVGANNGSADVTDSAATGPVYGNHTVGGLVGYNDIGSVTDSYATGTVATNRTFGNFTAGGLVGQNVGEVSRSYATGPVTSDQLAGGLVGWNNGGTVTEAYAVGAVSGTNYVGGLAGYNSDGTGDGTLTGSYWDTVTTGQQTGIGVDDGQGAVDIEGLTTGEMQGTSAKSNLDAFDFQSTWDVETGGEESYPFLTANAQTPAPDVNAVSATPGRPSDRRESEAAP